jgi:hypothetical protein
MPVFAPNPQDVYAFYVFRQVAAELERHCVGIYLSNREQLVPLHDILVAANQSIQTLRMNLAPNAQCSSDPDCPPLHVCNGGECEVMSGPPPPPSPLREAPQRPKK